MGQGNSSSLAYGGDYHCQTCTPSSLFNKNTNSDYTVSYSNYCYSSNNSKKYKVKGESCLGDYTSMCATPILDCSRHKTMSFAECCKPHYMIVESYNNKEDALRKARYYKDKNFNVAFNAYKTYLDMCGSNNNSYNNDSGDHDSYSVNEKKKLKPFLNNFTSIELQGKDKNENKNNSLFSSDETKNSVIKKKPEESSNNLAAAMSNKNGRLVKKNLSSIKSALSSSLHVAVSHEEGAQLKCLDLETNAARRGESSYNNNESDDGITHASNNENILLDNQYPSASTTTINSNKSSRLHSSDSLKVSTAGDKPSDLQLVTSPLLKSAFPSSSICDSNLISPPLQMSHNDHSLQFKVPGVLHFEDKSNSKMTPSTLLNPFPASLTSSDVDSENKSNSNQYSSKYMASICDEIAQLCFSNRYPEEALLWYDKAISFDNTHAMYFYRKGVILQSLGQIPQAIRAFNEALNFDSKCKPAIFNLGVVMLNQNPEESLRLFTQLLLIEPDNTEVMSLMAECHQIQGRITEAIAYLNRVIELDTNNFAVKRTLQKIQTRLNNAAV